MPYLEAGPNLDGTAKSVANKPGRGKTREKKSSSGGSSSRRRRRRRRKRRRQKNELMEERW
jgi:hypothetical protein